MIRIRGRRQPWIFKKQPLDKLRPFPEHALRSLHDSLIVDWTYNSNAIEGNTLSLKETKLVLEDGIAVGGKSLREHFEAVNHRRLFCMLKTLFERRSRCRNGR